MQEESSRRSQDSETRKNIIEQEEDNRLNSLVQRNLERKQTLGLSLTGRICSGVFKYDTTLSVFYVLKAGPQWEQVGGQPSGMSQRSTCSQQSIVWNFPFSATYSSKNIIGWPELVLVFYGTDYFGRSTPKAYGNIFFPRSQGIHRRKIKIFKPNQPSSIWSCLQLITGSPLQIKNVENILSNGKQRQNLVVEYSGEVEIEIQIKWINFQKFGYQ